MVALRTIEAADYPAIAEFYNRVNPRAPPLSADMIEHFERTADPARPTLQMVAEERGEAVGIGVLAASRPDSAISRWRGGLEEVPYQARIWPQAA